MLEALQEHLIALRQRAVSVINHLHEYGAFDAETGEDVSKHSIAREMRGLGEIEAVMIQHGSRFQA